MAVGILCLFIYFLSFVCLLIELKGIQKYS